jgi:hypothetical protein
MIGALNRLIIEPCRHLFLHQPHHSSRNKKSLATRLWR